MSVNPEKPNIVLNFDLNQLHIDELFDTMNNKLRIFQHSHIHFIY
jgi:hypothetical protein